MMESKKEDQKRDISSRKEYTPVKIEKIKLDKDISIQLQSPPGDPMGEQMENGTDNGLFNPYA